MVEFLTLSFSFVVDLEVDVYLEDVLDDDLEDVNLDNDNFSIFVFMS